MSCSVRRQLVKTSGQDFRAAILKKVDHDDDDDDDDEEDDASQEADDNLFADKSFPPDESSLTYVYSGDDKYEKMVFRRPRAMCVSPNLYGIGGVCHIQFPGKLQWTDRHWFLHALAIVSLNPRWMEKLVPGFKKYEQGFGKGHSGLFRFRLWRFGSWTEQLVDDYLPVLDGKHAYCPPLGTPPEYWGPLLEKAYAKFHKAYEAIEMGNPLNALTDLTGAICQRYDVKESAPSDDFHITYKSSFNRSMIVCWRRARSLKDADFVRQRKSTMASSVLWDFKLASDSSDNGVKSEASPYIITGAAKFPMRDGAMQEMLRFKDPYNYGGQWNGEFSLTHDASWNAVNPTFMDTYRPRVCTEQGESWMTYLDFCKHFSSLVICSSRESYKVVETSGERKYKADTLEDFTNICNVSTEPENGKWEFSETDFLGIPARDPVEKRGSVEIFVEETQDTVKVDTTTTRNNKYQVQETVDSEGEMLFIRRSKSARERKANSQHDSAKHGQTYTNSRHLKSRLSLVRGDDTGGAVRVPSSSGSSSYSSSSSRQNSRRGSHHTDSPRSTQSFLSITSGLGRKASTASSVSAVSNYSENSDAGSTYSMSDIKLKVNESRRSRSIRLPRSPRVARYSLPGGSAPSISSSQTSIFESRVDYFRPRGEWKEILSYKGQWTRETSGGGRHNLCNHSRNPRIAFTITKSESHCGDALYACAQGKSHAVVSLLQDYRQGSKIGTGLLTTIGFCIYRSKNPDRDEKRNISKLSLVTDVTSDTDSREVTSRVDLEPGYYILVPYTMEGGQVGEFLVRVLAERDDTAGKNACSIS